ncbi:MAG: DNA repair protein RecN [Verrucomicrobia bacterium]|nr:DNA repair protein RecN [Verrucomicrobiota bacterium]
MLTWLRIRNLAVVEELTLEFPPGLVTLTGETGAGKSIVLGALNLLLGQRADRGLIRSGADSCAVEAIFDVRALPADFGRLLDEKGVDPCEEGRLILKRAFSLGGANRQFVNGVPVPLSVLAEIGNWLVDIHGPHEHQSLLRPQQQLAVIDAYGKHEAELEALRDLFRRRRELEAQRRELEGDERTFAQQLDLLRHQTREIEDARLQPEEEESLEAEYRRAANASRLLELTREALNALDEEEAAAAARLAEAGRALRELERLDPEAGPIIQLHDQVSTLARELLNELRDYAEAIELDPERLAALEERRSLIQSLKRKYGATVEEVLRFGKEARERLARLESRGEELARIDKAIGEIQGEIDRIAEALSEKRRRLLPRLERQIRGHLAELGFVQSRFQIRLDMTAQAGPSGRDAAEFLFSPNPGEPPRPLRAIASSGEMARAMLAIKTALAQEDRIPVLVFDEVDANVGGETARAVGEKMRRVARRRQVFCITHLAPVAAAAQAHYLVEKQVRDGRTFTEVRPLSPEARVEELARMLGGRTAEARRLASSLLAAAAAQSSAKKSARAGRGVKRD